MNKFFNYTDVKELIPKKPLTANKYDFGNISVSYTHLRAHETQ